MGFGSAAKHHRLFAPWLGEDHSHAGMLGLRGAIHPEVGLMKEAVATIKGMLTDAGVVNDPIGVDLVEPSFLFEMQAQGSEGCRYSAEACWMRGPLSL